MVVSPLSGFDFVNHAASARSCGGISTETAKSGKIIAKSGNRYLHSRIDPVTEAKRQAGAIESGTDYAIFGAGLGYLIEELLLRTEIRIVWIEPCAEILSAALLRTDFESFARADRLRIYCGFETESQITDAFRGISNPVIVAQNSLMQKEHHELRARVQNVLGRRSVNAATLKKFDRLWARNFWNNLAILRNATPVSVFFGKLKGPAVVASAGPSLSDSIESLKRHREKVTLIAVDTAVRVLRASGIDPDFILSVDPQAVNHCYLEDYAGDANIVVDPVTCYITLRSLNVKKLFYFWSPFQLANLLFKHASKEPGEIAFGGSVATNAYDMARKLGCDPVYLIGQDLGFSNGQVHAKGATLEERLKWKETRIFHMETHNRIQRSALPVLWLEDVNGKAMPTNAKLMIFYQWFEKRLTNDAKLKLRTLQCTTRGVKFNSIDTATLEAIEGRRSNNFKNDETSFNTEALDTELKSMRGKLLRIRALLEICISKPASGAADSAREEMMQESEILGKLSSAAQGSIAGVLDSEQIGKPEQVAFYQELHSAADLYLRSLQKLLRIMADETGYMPQEMMNGSKT